MESYYAHIVDGIVASVEVVTDEFFLANPERYSGIWKKVGTPEQPFCGKDWIYLNEKDTIIHPKPFESWILNEENCIWEAPIKKPEGDYGWDEEKQKWILLIAK